MKYFLIAILFLSVACKDKEASNPSKGKIVSDKEVLIAKKKTQFKCEEDKCHESIVAIEDNGLVCTGVIDDGQIKVARECAEKLKCESMLITDINNHSYSCDSVSIDENLIIINSKEDLSSLNAVLADISKEKLEVDAKIVKKVSDAYIQEIKKCSLTFSSVSALESTKENSKFLAIKDCDNLEVGAVLFQDENLVSVNIKSDLLNISRSMVCGEYCDDKAVDKLNFLIDEITAKTKVKHLRKLMEGSEEVGHRRKTDLSLNDNQIVGKTQIVCLKNYDPIPKALISTETLFSQFGEVLSSKMVALKRSYIYFDYAIVFFLGNEFAMDRFTGENKTTVLGAESESNIIGIENFSEYYKDNDFKFKKVKVQKCENFHKILLN